MGLVKDLLLLSSLFVNFNYLLSEEMPNERVCVCGPVQDSEFWRVVMLCISFVFIHCTPKSIHSSGFEMLENGWSSREARTGSGSGGNPNEFFSVHRLWKARLKFNCFHFNSACFRLRTFLFCFELMLKICSDECPLIMSSANLTFGKLSYGASFFLFRPLWNVKVQTRSSKVKYYWYGPCRSFVVSAYFPAIFGISLFVFVSFLRRYSLF